MVAYVELTTLASVDLINLSRKLGRMRVFDEFDADELCVGTRRVTRLMELMRKTAWMQDGKWRGRAASRTATSNLMMD